MKTLRPDSESQLCAIVGEVAAKAGLLKIQGGGTRTGTRPLAKTSLCLSTAGLNGITLYEPASLTLSVRAGTPLADVEAALDGETQHLPFEPSDWRGLLGTRGRSTIGGVVAANAAGPRRIQAGSVRDSAIGIRFVDGTGAAIKSGGRVMKNVTGYDLVKLLCGSQGTLGVISEITFKLLPRPQTSASVIVSGLSIQQAVSAMSAGLTSPFDVTGAAHLPAQAASRTLLRVEGFEKSVSYRAARLQQILSPLGDCRIELSGKASAKLWRDVRDVAALAGKAGTLWKISLRPSSAPGFLSVIGQVASCEFLLDWGGGLVWLLLPDSPDSGTALIKNALGGHGGHATLMRSGTTGGEPPQGFLAQKAPVDAISAALRRQFDPAGIFNAGRMEFNAAWGPIESPKGKQP